MVGGLASLGELNRQILSASQALFRSFPLCAHVPFFQISCYSCIILVSVPSCSFTLVVLMREVYCVIYTPRAWDPRSLQCFGLWTTRIDCFINRVLIKPNLIQLPGGMGGVMGGPAMAAMAAMASGSAAAKMPARYMPPGMLQQQVGGEGVIEGRSGWVISGLCTRRVGLGKG